jgi:hypothetical protein
MKTPIPWLLLALVVLSAGCGQSPKSQRADMSGFFTLTNNAGIVYWEYLHDSETNDMQFVLWLPAADQTGPAGGQGSQRPGYDYYDYFLMKTKHDGHQWKIENDLSQKTGTQFVRFSDLTANTVTNIDLVQIRMWQISDDKTLTPLGKIDPLIAQKLSLQTESSMKQLYGGRTPAEFSQSRKMRDQLTLQWLELFQRMKPSPNTTQAHAMK